jgi:hypothetical protein
MANMAMNEGIESVIDRNIDLIADTIKAALVKAAYVANKDNQFIDEGGANDIVDHRVTGTTDQTIGSKATGKDTTSDFAYFDGGDVTYSAVPAGETAAGVGVYKDTGTATTSKILGYFDTTDTPTNGGDITIQWATPANGGILRFNAA